MRLALHTRSMKEAPRYLTLLFILLALGVAHPADAEQLGALLSPGRLARAHAKLEGAANCQQCHVVGRKVTAEKCLSCHKPIAERMAAKKGVHRAVTECVSCHVEHAGVDGELRRVDPNQFDHARETGLALDGRHAPLATKCASCHKTRSFLDARPACASCHQDTHKGALGADCLRCHSTKVPFKDADEVFDHTRARFQLTGAHREVTCAECHKTATYRDAPSAAEAGACSSCHEDPHARKLGASCVSCHTTAVWKTQRVDHARTDFPLVGAHAQVACAKCHQAGAMTTPLKADRCASCHANVHKGSLSEDCQSCHTEKTFKDAPFDHGQQTDFPLDGKHEGLPCAECHTKTSSSDVPLALKVLDYRGAEAACVSCHGDNDPHRGAFGRRCEACHVTATFDARAFEHPGARPFFGGRHRPLTCEQCHKPEPELVLSNRPTMRSSPASFECVSCHRDVHVGQLGEACERCHTVDGEHFRALAFSHGESRFPLTGKHETTDCAKCHTTEARAFPSGHGTAVVYRPIAAECRSCHEDTHLGQLDSACERCHTTTAFAIPAFRHQEMDDFFAGFHGRYGCVDCHKLETGSYPAGQGRTIRYRVGRTCADCHRGY